MKIDRYSIGMPWLAMYNRIGDVVVFKFCGYHIYERVGNVRRILWIVSGRVDD